MEGMLTELKMPTGASQVLLSQNVLYARVPENAISVEGKEVSGVDMVNTVLITYASAAGAVPNVNIAMAQETMC